MSTYYVVPGRRGHYRDAYPQPHRRLEPAYGAFGEPLTAAQRSAWLEYVIGNAGGYRLPAKAATHADAIAAFQRLMFDASRENPVNATHYRARAMSAPHELARASIVNILTMARDLVKSAPRAHAVARTVLAASMPAAPPPFRRRARRSETVTLPPEEVPAESFTAKLPTWWPWAAGGLAVAAAWLLIPNRRAAA